MTSLTKKDEEICRGCLCIIMSKEKDRDLNLMCHGNPFIPTPADDTTQLICPCSECLVKRMCRSVCSKYDFYSKVGLGEISVECYQQRY